MKAILLDQRPRHLPLRLAPRMAGPTAGTFLAADFWKIITKFIQTQCLPGLESAWGLPWAPKWKSHVR